MDMICPDKHRTGQTGRAADQTLTGTDTQEAQTMSDEQPNPPHSLHPIGHAGPQPALTLADDPNRRRLVAERRSEWQQIEIYRHDIYGHQLWIDGDLQISESDLAYNMAMTAPLIAAAATGEVLVMGGGDGGVLQGLFNQADPLGLPVHRLRLADIDAAVVELSRTWLPRLHGQSFDRAEVCIEIGDAFAAVRESRDLDAVIYDLTMDPIRGDVSPESFVRDTLATIRAALRPDGVLSMQCGGESAADRQRIAGIEAEAARCFAEVRLQQVVVPSYGERWTFLTARAA